jgi:protein gp37
MRDLLKTKLRKAARHEHIWWGVSVENRRHGLPRVAHLRAARTKMSFLSIEPLLEHLGEIDLGGIDWAIVGGESGPKARPLRRAWVVDIRRQCRAAGVPFFFKQWGGVRKGETGRELDGRTYDEFPEVKPIECPVKRDRDLMRDSVNVPLLSFTGTNGVVNTVDQSNATVF